MTTRPHAHRSSGFALIEALVALMILSVGLLGVVKLQSLVLTTGTDTKAKSMAIALVESKIDLLRNRTLKATNEANTSGTAISGSSFDAYLANGTTTETVTPSGAVNTFTIVTSISGASGTSNGKLIQVVVTWDDLLTNKLSGTTGSTQAVSGRTIISWDDPSLGRSVSTGTVGGGPAINVTLKTPTGLAQRGDGSVDSVCEGCQSTNDGQGTRIRTVNGITELRSSTGALLLTLPASSVSSETQFTTIAGKVYIDKGINGFSVDASELSVRLSSEGVCLFNNTSTTPIYNSATQNNNTLLYSYFSYVCYVGQGWYGNVGIWNSGQQTPKVCLGDPSFNSGLSDGTLISPHAAESPSRSYRGFKNKTGGGYYSVGVLGGSSYPNSGRPQPSSYSYGISSGDSDNYFNHDFLVTKSNQDCTSRMSAYTLSTGKFVRNAGQYFCISPDEDTASTDVCPSIWPGFESQVSGSGGTNFALTVSLTGSGTVSSSPTGINCNTGSCTSSFSSGSSVALTATPSAGYSFSGWSGACSGTGSCVVTMSGDQSVAATFSQGTAGTYQLSVTMAGTGSGTVSSSPGGITCTTGTCSFNFTASDVVTLTASPSSSTFTGWGGACSGSAATCTVTMSQATSVTATFAAVAQATYSLNLSKLNVGTGAGTITSSPSGINCGTGCTSASYAFNSGTTVTLTAAANGSSTFGGWGGACSGTSTTCTLTMSSAQSVSATFYPAACTTIFSGSVTSLPANANSVQFDITPSVSGNPCTNSNGTSNYSCSFSLAGGTNLSIVASWKLSGNTRYYSGTLYQTADCVTHTNTNIP